MAAGIPVSGTGMTRSASTGASRARCLPISWRTLHLVRPEMGKHLALEAPVEADLVIPVPDTGMPAAIGYASASGIPYAEGLIKNRYVYRTFIQPDDQLRQ